MIQSSKPKRKRQRLDHLSHEEKLMRRKLKNRMAAQSARDRKKVKMNDLEREAIVVAKQRNALLIQNKKLKQSNESLEKQNIELKRRLGLLESKPSVKRETMDDLNDWNETLESAELISDPQPQEQVSRPVTLSSRVSAQPLMTLFVCWLITKNPMLYSMFSTCIQKNCSIQTTTQKTYNCRQAIKYKPLITTSHHMWDQLKT
ncbi:unnamed protein product [Medioppia subpectinata]|uniref:X-box-binding protein 1 n=1 Tax=Medioppia subpectinata TaxID=1979941 RepID=A0A7R9QIV8_9ACAR|nr:unnamed protein product [Medioppia subpectinata]CAG2121593.1 unnamed protein product [Medioppia subpectinata]